MNRDIQIKEIKGMYKAINGCYPYHIDFNKMDDDEVDAMFKDLSSQLYEKKSDESDEDWRQYLNSQEPVKNSLSSFIIKR